LRAVILHAWLTHIHPFSDGNGRTTRAISTFELVRGGAPPIVIKRARHRDEYLDSLGASDAAGDLGLFLEFMLRRHQESIDALLGIVSQAQGLTPQQALLREAQRRRCELWNRSLELLTTGLHDRLGSQLEPLGGEAHLTNTRQSLELDEFLALCEGQSIPQSWAFRVESTLPGLTAVDYLAWIGYRPTPLREAVGSQGPCLFWSRRSPQGYPPWEQVTGADAPDCDSLTADLSSVGDRWYIFSHTATRVISTSELAAELTNGFMRLLSRQP